VSESEINKHSKQHLRLLFTCTIVYFVQSVANTKNLTMFSVSSFLRKKILKNKESSKAPNHTRISPLSQEALDYFHIPSHILLLEEDSHVVIAACFKKVLEGNAASRFTNIPKEHEERLKSEIPGGIRTMHRLEACSGEIDEMSTEEIFSLRRYCLALILLGECCISLRLYDNAYCAYHEAFALSCTLRCMNSPNPKVRQLLHDSLISLVRFWLTDDAIPLKIDHDLEGKDVQRILLFLGGKFTLQDSGSHKD
jgi:hypothetical protein